MSDDKRELNNGEGAVASGFGASDSGSSSGFGASDTDLSVGAFGAFPADGESDTDGSYSSDPLHREEIVTEHLDELPDVENVEELIGDGHVYDEETAGALVALMFAKTHKDDEDAPLITDTYDEFHETIPDSPPLPDNSATAAVKKKSRIGLLLGAIFGIISIALMIIFFVGGERHSAAPSPFENMFVFSENPDGSYTLVEYIGPEVDVDIPADYNGVKISAIGERAFYHRADIVSIAIPEGILRIEADAFYNCINLSRVTLPDTLLEIGDRAFAFCAELSEIRIPMSVDCIRSEAFLGADKLTIYTDHTAAPPSWAFDWSGGRPVFWDGEADLPIIPIEPTVPDPTKDFSYYTKDGETVITGYNGDGGEVVIPSEFNGNTNLRISDYAFEYNKKITKITIPGTVKEIGDWAFYNCSSLKSVKLEYGVERINSHAFNGCTALLSIRIPESVTNVSARAFVFCRDLTIYCEAANKPIGWSDDWNYDHASVSWGSFIESPASDFTYGITNYRVKITRYTGSSTRVVIPSYIDGLRVDEIADAAFAYNSTMTSLVIPESVEKIGVHSFYGCTSLERINFSAGLETIGNGAFYECSKLTSVKLPEGLTGIGTYAFSRCTSLTTAVIPETISEISEGIFEDCSALVEVNIPRSVGTISRSAFRNCSSLERVDILSTVSYIGYMAFHDCNSLSIYCESGSDVSLDWDSSWNFSDRPVFWEYVEPSPESDFNYYEQGGEVIITGYRGDDQSVVIPDSINGMPVVMIGDSAFDGANFESIVVPGTVRSIGSRAFGSCLNLRSVKLREGIAEIGSNAFDYCFSLSSITIPASVSNIGDGAFSNCEKLVEVIDNSSLIINSTSSGPYGLGASVLEIHAGKSKLDERADGFVFYTVGGKSYLVAYNGSNAELTLPDGYNGENYEINYGAFYWNEGIVNVVIPESVLMIGEMAFGHCGSLESVTVNANITEIADYTFYECTSLSEISIPYGVTSIGYSAFNGCTSLSKVIIPSSVTNIGEGAFANCSGLTGVSIPAGVVSIGRDAFIGSYQLTIYCERDSENPYWDSDWNYDGRPVVWESNLGSDPSDFSFHESGGEITITGYRGTGGDVVIPEEISGYPVGVIDSRVFMNMDYITSVYIPSGVTEIKNEAFLNCKNLKTIYFNAKSLSAPQDYEHMIWGGVGANLTVGTTVVIGRAVEEIPAGAFYQHGVESNITAVVFENGGKCTAIGESAFGNLGKLRSVKLSSSVVSIGEYAFYACFCLDSVKLNSVLESIGKGAFAYTALREIYIPSTVKSISEGAFECSPLESITVNGGNVYYKSVDGSLYSSNGTVLLQYAIGKTDTEFYIPSGVSQIAEDAFNGASNLTVLVLPQGLKRIGACAFASCYNLTEIRLPYGVTEIGNSAFIFCSRLEKINIPSSASLIENSVFNGCTALTVYCEAESQPEGWHSAWNENGAEVVWGYCEESPVSDFQYFDSGDGITIYKYIGTSTDVIIPAMIDGKPVTAIYDEAFSGMSEISRVRIPDTVTTIGVKAFMRCQGLIEVNMPTSLVTIGERAFSYCGAITRPALPDGLEYIGDQAFLYCSSLYDVVIPSTVTYVGDRAFQECGYLTIRCEAESLPSGWHADWNYDVNDVVWAYNPTPANDFEYTESNGEITITKYVGSGGKVVIPSMIDKKPVVAIGDSAFETTYGVTEVEIPDSVKSIGNSAFTYCSDLTSVKLGNGVNVIGNYAFSSCDQLASVVIPDSVTIIGDYAFYDCDVLASVTLGNKLEGIGECAFMYSDSLTSIVIPESAISIGASAFAYCYSLTIYCEAESRPDGWNSSWNRESGNVVWGYDSQ